MKFISTLILLSSYLALGDINYPTPNKFTLDEKKVIEDALNPPISIKKISSLCLIASKGSANYSPSFLLKLDKVTVKGQHWAIYLRDQLSSKYGHELATLKSQSIIEAQRFLKSLLADPGSVKDFYRYAMTIQLSEPTNFDAKVKGEVFQNFMDRRMEEHCKNYVDKIHCKTSQRSSQERIYSYFLNMIRSLDDRTIVNYLERGIYLVDSSMASYTDKSVKIDFDIPILDSRIMEYCITDNLPSTETHTGNVQSGE